MPGEREKKHRFQGKKRTEGDMPIKPRYSAARNATISRNKRDEKKSDQRHLKRGEIGYEWSQENSNFHREADERLQLDQDIQKEKFLKKQKRFKETQKKERGTNGEGKLEGSRRCFQKKKIRREPSINATGIHENPKPRTKKRTVPRRNFAFPSIAIV